MSSFASLEINGVAVPRLAFGLGSLMKWAPNHAHPLPTDSTQEVNQALSAGFRHFNTGDLYTNNASAAAALRSSGLKRKDIFISLKLNTYANLGCGGAQHMIDSTKREIERFGLEGYVDILQLHFPPRGYPGNLSNREAWRVLEDLKDQGLARLIGVSNWSLDDYASIMDHADLKHKPQVNELEFNPFLLYDPKFQALRKYESEHGIVNMSYGLLTVLAGKVDKNLANNLTTALQEGSNEAGWSEAEILLYWAHHRLNGIIVTTTSKAERAARLVSLLSSESSSLPAHMLAAIEQGAQRDGYEGKVFYKHPHIDKAKTQASG